MNTIKKFSAIVFIAVLVVSCSTVKVTDGWKDARIENVKAGKVLVVFKSKDNIARQRFEKDMSNEVEKRGEGFVAVPSYIDFPNADPDEKYTPEDVQKLRDDLKASNINIAIVTTIKSVRESTVTSVTEDPGYYGPYGAYGGYGYYSGRYRTGYYHSMNMAYVSPRNSTAITTTEKEFVVETLLYDLSLPESEQLLSVVTSLVDNPKNIVTTSDDFAKAVIKQLFKK